MNSILNDAGNEMTGMFNGMFGKVAPGMCRLSMSGDIAVKAGDSYKTYNVKTGNLVTVGNFAIDIGNDFFFVIPTNHLQIGDIILVNKGDKSKPVPECVISKPDKHKVEVINYTDATIETLLLQKHVFMGNTYFYGKIVSLLGNGIKSGKGGKNGIMKYMMLSAMCKDGNGSGNALNSMLPLMLMGNTDFSSMFDGMFDDDSFDSDDTDDVDDDSDEAVTPKTSRTRKAPIK